MERNPLSSARPALDAAHQRLDLPADEVLLQRWEPLVRHLAYRYGRAEDREDLAQVARLALWKAAGRFDPARGCQFRTYAASTIVGSMLHYLRDQARLRGIPRCWWELHGRLKPERDAAAQALGHPPSTAELAEWLGVNEEDVVGAMAVPDLCYTVSLDEAPAVAAGEGGMSLGDLFGAPDPRLEAAELQEVLRQAIAQLPERLRVIIQRCYFEGQSQQKVGMVLGLSQMHISRLKRRALGELRGALREALGTADPVPAAPLAHRHPAVACLSLNGPQRCAKQL